MKLVKTERFLTMKQAAELLTIKRGTLYNWRSKGILSKDKRYKESYILGIREKYAKGQLVV